MDEAGPRVPGSSWSPAPSDSDVATEPWLVGVPRKRSGAPAPVLDRSSDREPAQAQHATPGDQRRPLQPGAFRRLRSAPARSASVEQGRPLLDPGQRPALILGPAMRCRTLLQRLVQRLDLLLGQKRPPAVQPPRPAQHPGRPRPGTPAGNANPSSHEPRAIHHPRLRAGICPIGGRPGSVRPTQASPLSLPHDGRPARHRIPHPTDVARTRHGPFTMANPGRLTRPDSSSARAAVVQVPSPDSTPARHLIPCGRDAARGIRTRTAAAPQLSNVSLPSERGRSPRGAPGGPPEASRPGSARKPVACGP